MCIFFLSLQFEEEQGGNPGPHLERMGGCFYEIRLKLITVAYQSRESAEVPPPCKSCNRAMKADREKSSQFMDCLACRPSAKRLCLSCGGGFSVMKLGSETPLVYQQVAFHTQSLILECSSQAQNHLSEGVRFTVPGSDLND